MILNLISAESPTSRLQQSGQRFNNTELSQVLQVSLRVRILPDAWLQVKH